MYDLIILGGGPAGLTAGLYACRSKLNTLIIEKMYLGGRIINAHKIENYPGYDNISGPELISKMEAQTKKYGLQIVNKDVVGLDITGDVKKVQTEDNLYEAKAIILAMGTTNKKLGLEKEKKFIGSGVSFCATCDAAFYKEADVAVIGGDNTAVIEAQYLTKFAKKVYIIYKGNSLTAVKAEQDKAFSNEKIEIILDSVVEDIEGDNQVEGLKLKNLKTGEETTIKIDGMFISIGTAPNIEILNGVIDMDEHSYIITDDDMRTNIPGVFAAGDIRHKSLRQLVTAMSDGAIAAYIAGKYIEALKK
jgi:thioredoxin reductase (NADPH)